MIIEAEKERLEIEKNPSAINAQLTRYAEET
jgi:hypothetical protein